MRISGKDSEKEELQLLLVEIYNGTATLEISLEDNDLLQSYA